MESASTVQKVFEGFSVSCSTLHSLNTLVLVLGEKTSELLPLTLLVVTSCSSQQGQAAKSHSCKCPANSLEVFRIPTPRKPLDAGCDPQVSAQLLPDLIRRLCRRFQRFCLQNSCSQVSAAPQSAVAVICATASGATTVPHTQSRTGTGPTLGQKGRARKAGHALASKATARAEGHRAAAHLLLSKQHRKRNPPHPKWEEQLSFLFLRCYQELWKVHFKSVLKVPLTISLSSTEGLSSRC